MNGSSWVDVAASESATSTETITYTAGAGTYRWDVYAYSGSGSFTHEVRRALTRSGRLMQAPGVARGPCLHGARVVGRWVPSEGGTPAAWGRQGVPADIKVLPPKSTIP